MQALDDGLTALTDVFNYTMTDGTANDTATLTISITGANDAPIAVNDVNSLTEDTGSVGQNTKVTGVLGNDTDVDDVLADFSVTSIRTGGTEGSGTAGTLGTALNGTYGTLLVSADGTYTYTLYTQAQNASAYNTVQALDDGSTTLTDFFNYTMTDGTATHRDADHHHHRRQRCAGGVSQCERCGRDGWKKPGLQAADRRPKAMASLHSAASPSRIRTDWTTCNRSP